MLDKTLLVKAANLRMPFGKYAGKRLLHLPEEYLLWFRHKGFPNGELGDLLALVLEIKIEGLEAILEPLIVRDKEG